MTEPQWAKRAAHVAQVLVGQGHSPDVEDVERIRRLLAGELTIEAAYAEVDGQFAVPERAPVTAPTP